MALKLTEPPTMTRDEIEQRLELAARDIDDAEYEHYELQIEVIKSDPCDYFEAFNGGVLIEHLVVIHAAMQHYELAERASAIFECLGNTDLLRYAKQRYDEKAA